MLGFQLCNKLWVCSSSYAQDDIIDSIVEYLNTALNTAPPFMPLLGLSRRVGVESDLVTRVEAP